MHVCVCLWMRAFYHALTAIHKACNTTHSDIVLVKASWWHAQEAPHDYDTVDISKKSEFRTPTPRTSRNSFCIQHHATSFNLHFFNPDHRSLDTDSDEATRRDQATNYTLQSSGSSAVKPRRHRIAAIACLPWVTDALNLDKTNRTKRTVIGHDFLTELQQNIFNQPKDTTWKSMVQNPLYVTDLMISFFHN